MLSYMSIGMGECREKVRGQMIEVSLEYTAEGRIIAMDAVRRLTRTQKMIQPVGKPPEVQD
jgi:hypothetical protein